jgi:Rps23 Pro-64 3,4-dihydroxylase Tpa1-like proline 4-hydroxylase
MLNTDLNKRKLKYSFLKEGFVIIDDFFQQDYADRVFNHFNNEMPQWWWSVSTRPAPDGEQKMHNCYYNDENSDLIEEKEKAAREAFAISQFSYIFRRTLDDHVKDCNCTECQLRAYLATSEIHNFITNITDIPVQHSFELFASWYKEGDFLSMHSDGDNGQVGFVYNISKDWRPEWGGMLHFLEEGRPNVVKKVISPRYNALVLFDLSTTAGADHFVSHVNTSQAKRLSFTGWFK